MNEQRKNSLNIIPFMLYYIHPLDAKHVESPFIELGMLCTALYFLFYLLFIPAISIIENTLLNLSLNSSIAIKSANNKKIFKNNFRNS